jgi:TolA-binding protein
MTDKPEPWHLNKGIPIALIITILVQTGGIIWWASGIDERVTNNATSIERLQAQTDTMRNLAQTQAVQLGRIEEQISGLRGDIGRLVNTLERTQR